jgi:hypothetical protein
MTAPESGGKKRANHIFDYITSQVGFPEDGEPGVTTQAARHDTTGGQSGGAESVQFGSNIEALDVLQRLTDRSRSAQGGTSY